MIEWINLREERDFGEKVNATFQFVRQNFKSLSLCLLLMGAPIMIAGILLFRYIIILIKIVPDNQNPTGSFLTLVVFFLIYMIAGSWLSTLIYSYINEYLDGNLEITCGKVFKRALMKIGKVLGATIITAMLVTIASVLFVIPGIFLAVSLSLVTVILMAEDKSIVKSIWRSISLIRGKWWSTFGLLMVISIIVVLLQFVINMILAIISAYPRLMHQSVTVSETSKVLFLSFMSIGATMLLPIIYIAIAFQYFNLVESKESQGLRQQIDRAANKTDIILKNEGEY